MSFKSLDNTDNECSLVGMRLLSTVTERIAEVATVTDLNIFQFTRFLHILFSLTLFFGLGTTMMNTLQSRRVRSPAELLPLWQSTARAGARFSIPSGILLFVFGYIAAESHGYDLFATGWLLTSLIITLILILIGIFIMRRHVGLVLGEIHQAISSGGDMTDSLVSRLRAPIPRITGLLQMILLLVVVVLMVFKPF